MTLSMILSLVVLVAMIAMILFDVLPFGMPPIACCILIVIFGSLFGSQMTDLADPWDISYAFAGFTNNMISKVKEVMTKLVEKGGFKSYVLLLIVVMLGASILGMGSTAFYVLIFSLVVTMPYSDKLPGSKLMLPLGIASNHPLIPINVALQYGVAVSVLAASGLQQGITMVQFAIVTFFLSMGFLVWAIIGYKFLPSHPVAEPTVENSAVLEDDGSAVMTSWKETAAILAFVVSIVAMMLVDTLGQLSYIIPGAAAIFMVLIKVLDFNEFRDNLFSPIILMTAGVIPVANALADSGLSTLVGNSVAAFVGTGVPPFLLLIIFTVLCSTFACFTGSQVGIVMIFAPIAIAVCQGLGYNPTAACVAVTLSGWAGHYMPIDGLPAMAYGMGKYTMVEFWKFTIPQYVIRILFLCAGALIVFPM